MDELQETQVKALVTLSIGNDYMKKLVEYFLFLVDSSNDPGIVLSNILQKQGLKSIPSLKIEVNKLKVVDHDGNIHTEIKLEDFDIIVLYEFLTCCEEFMTSTANRSKAKCRSSYHKKCCSKCNHNCPTKKCKSCVKWNHTCCIKSIGRCDHPCLSIDNGQQCGILSSECKRLYKPCCITCKRCYHCADKESKTCETRMLREVIECLKNLRNLVFHCSKENFESNLDVYENFPKCVSWEEVLNLCCNQIETLLDYLYQKKQIKQLEVHETVAKLRSIQQESKENLFKTCLHMIANQLVFLNHEVSRLNDIERKRFLEENIVISKSELEAEVNTAVKKISNIINVRQLSIELCLKPDMTDSLIDTIRDVEKYGRKSDFAKSINKIVKEELSCFFQTEESEDTYSVFLTGCSVKVNTVQEATLKSIDMKVKVNPVESSILKHYVDPDSEESEDFWYKLVAVMGNVLEKVYAIPRTEFSFILNTWETGSLILVFTVKGPFFSHGRKIHGDLIPMLLKECQVLVDIIFGYNTVLEINVLDAMKPGLQLCWSFMITTPYDDFDDIIKTSADRVVLAIESYLKTAKLQSTNMMAKSSSDITMEKDVKEKIHTQVSVRNPDRYYPIKPDQQCGNFILINNISRSSSVSVDVEALKKLFRDLHFVVKEHDEVTCNDLRLALKHASEDISLTWSVLVVCILCHGKEGILYCADGALYVQELISLSCGTSANGKPKIFLVQTCRGKDLTSMDVVDRLQTISDKIDGLPKFGGDKQLPGPDILYLHSTIPYCGSCSLGKRMKTTFIQAVVNMFRENSHKMDVMMMLQRICQLVEDREKNQVDDEFIPSHCELLVSTLLKRLYLFPPQHSGIDYLESRLADTLVTSR